MNNIKFEIENRLRVISKFKQNFNGIFKKKLNKLYLKIILKLIFIQEYNNMMNKKR